jgi:Flp pilus assembly protein TadG
MPARSLLASRASASNPRSAIRIGTFTRQVARTGWSAHRLAYDKHGNAAIEFAMLAPLLTLTLLGTIEMSRAINMDREFNQETDMMGDLVACEQFHGTSQGDALTNLNAMVASVQEVMQPYDTASLALGIFSVYASRQ